MEITEVRVFPKDGIDKKLKAYVTVTFDNAFVVRNIKVIEGRDQKLFVAMPSRRQADGSYVDIAHPITREFRRGMETRILDTYLEELELAGKEDEALDPEETWEEGDAEARLEEEEAESSRSRWFSKH